jgi:hypothetical protein
MIDVTNFKVIVNYTDELYMSTGVQKYVALKQVLELLCVECIFPVPSFSFKLPSCVPVYMIYVLFLLLNYLIQIIVFVGISFYLLKVKCKSLILDYYVLFTVSLVPEAS